MPERQKTHKKETQTNGYKLRRITFGVNSHNKFRHKNYTCKNKEWTELLLLTVSKWKSFSELNRTQQFKRSKKNKYEKQRKNLLKYFVQSTWYRTDCGDSTSLTFVLNDKFNDSQKGFFFCNFLGSDPCSVPIDVVVAPANHHSD